MEINLKLPLSRFFPAILALALAVGCSRGAPPPNAGKPPGFKVKLASVQSAVIDDSSEYIGTLESRRSVSLQPRIEGQVSQIFVKYGDQVPEGTQIMLIDPAKQQATVNSNIAAAQGAQADLQNAKATLSSLEAQRTSKVADVKYNQRQYERYSSLYAQGAANQQQRDQFADSLESARSSLNSIGQQIQAQRSSVEKAQRSLQQAQANIKQEQVQLQYFKITAPFTGVVGDIPVKVGDYVNTSTKLTTITKNQPLEVNIPIPIELAPKLQIGMPVELINQQGQSVGISKVFFISPQTANNTQSVQIKSLFDNSNNQLRSDQIVRAKVVWDQRPGVLIPAAAVSRIGGQNFVFVAQPPQPPKQSEQAKSPPGQSPAAQPKLVAKQKPVKLSDRIQGNNIQVIEGLQPGDKIVTSGILNLTDGAPIIPES